ncbi:distal tail protein Dit [Fictibacillus sp. JL2B1089]|uniref:distal tail protein Dit n=1 Tax=Fictibacillus sp. JL2B1089 TaxID=3399565 RepID=UPI003A84C4D2
MNGFVWRGKHSNDFGITVLKVLRTMLPPLNDKSISIPNRPGSYWFGSDLGVREFKVLVAIKDVNKTKLIQKARLIASWLLSEEEEELIFDAEPDKSFFAFLGGTTEIESTLANRGKITLTFYCPDPYAYGPNKESSPYTSSPILTTIGGQEKTPPIFLAKFNEPSTFLSVAIKESHIHIGSPAGVEEITVPKEVALINDGMSSTSSWIANTVVDGGSVSGSFKSSGLAFSANSYGTGSAWHGPSLKRMLQTPVQDFKMESVVGFYSDQQNEVGRLEIYVLDSNGVAIGKIGLKDAWSDERTMVEARAGKLLGGKMLMAYIGNVVKKNRKVTVKKKVKGKTITETDTVTDGFSTYANFYGVLRLSRVGNKWSAHIGRIDPATGRRFARMTINWTDKNNQHMDKVAGVAVHLAQHGTKPFIKTAYISSVKLWQINTITEIDVPEIVSAGDEIEIDCETGAVYLNGDPFLEELNISSEFFHLAAGQNQIAFEPADKCSLQVFHRGRYL